jgi:diguanylate cyclase (GGDEF)-like protein
MLFIDFDGFKQINDTYGHRAGDELLSLFAKQLMEHFSLKEGDESQNFILNNTTLPYVIPARLGGDEFIVLFKHIKNKADIKEKAEALLSAVFGEYELYGNIHISLNGSVGIALFPEHGSTYETLIKAADLAMYEAKNSENDTICFAS